jgi:hypothetical protein
MVLGIEPAIDRCKTGIVSVVNGAISRISSPLKVTFVGFLGSQLKRTEHVPPLDGSFNDDAGTGFLVWRIEPEAGVVPERLLSG